MSANVQFEQSKNQNEIQRMQLASQLKQQEMQMQHEFDMQLKQADLQAMKSKEQTIEDRKDKRIKMEGTQQSKMITQRQNEMLPIDFESGDAPQEEESLMA